MREQETGFDSRAYTQDAKKRALELLEQGELKQAIDSMVADLAKDPTRSETQKSMIGMMGMTLKNEAILDEQKVRTFIKGFKE